MASGAKPAGHLDNKRGRRLPFLRTKKEMAKLVHRPLFQNVNKDKTVLAEMKEMAALQSDYTQIGADGGPLVDTTVALEDEDVGSGLASDEAALSPSEGVADMAAGLEDYEQEDTLMYSEEDLLYDLAFRAVVANVQTLSAPDREKINTEFSQTLQKCRVARQAKPPAGPSKLSSRSNTPIRGVSFKKALAMKVLSPMKTLKHKIAKKGTLKDKDESPMKF